MPPPGTFPRIRSGPELARVQDAIASTVNPVTQAVVSTPIMGAAPPPWQPPDLLADFLPVAGQAAPGYHRDALGYAHGKGCVSTATGQAAGTVVYVIPAGYRPSEPQRVPVRGNGASYQSLTIAPTGDVSIDVVIAAAGTVDLAFTFLTEQ